MMTIPRTQPSPPEKEVTYYSQVPKKQTPPHSRKILKKNIERKMIKKDFGHHPRCGFWCWTDIVSQKYSHSYLNIGSSTCSEDYILIYYNTLGNAHKAAHLRVSMFRDNYDLREILNFFVLDQKKETSLTEIIDKFSIKLSNYKYPMKDIIWKHEYKL